MKTILKRLTLWLVFVAVPAMATVTDPHSFANFNQVKVKHIDLDLDVDFDQSRLSGSAEIQFEKLDASARQLVLDTRDLSVLAITSGDIHLAYRFGNTDPNLGTPLYIDLPAAGEGSTEVKR